MTLTSGILSRDKLLAAAATLEPLPASVTRLAALSPGDDDILDEIISAVSLDPVLTAEVLRFANSAFARRSREIATVEAAVVRLGATAVLRMATTKALSGQVKNLSGPAKAAAQRVWSHSVATAAAIETIATSADLPMPAEATSAAMLHDVGKLILTRTLTPPVLALLDELATGEGRTTIDAEREVLLVDHGELGAAAAESWQLPSRVVEAIRGHHGPFDGDDLITIVGLADAIAHAVDGEQPSEQADALLEALNLDNFAWPDLVDQTKRRIERVLQG